MSAAHPGPGGTALGSLEREGQGDTWLAPAASQHRARPFSEEHWDRTQGQDNTAPICGSSQAGRQEIVGYKDKIIYSEVDQTLEQVHREVMQSPSVEIQKAHLA